MSLTPYTANVIDHAACNTIFPLYPPFVEGIRCRFVIAYSFCASIVSSERELWQHWHLIPLWHLLVWLYKDKSLVISAVCAREFDAVWWVRIYCRVNFIVQLFPISPRQNASYDDKITEMKPYTAIILIRGDAERKSMFIAAVFGKNWKQLRQRLYAGRRFWCVNVPQFPLL